MGVTLREMGCCEEALEHGQQAVARFRTAMGDQHPHTAEYLNNVGLTMCALGCHVEALAHHQHARASTALY